MSKSIEQTIFVECKAAGFGVAHSRGIWFLNNVGVLNELTSCWNWHMSLICILTLCTMPFCPRVACSTSLSKAMRVSWRKIWPFELLEANKLSIEGWYWTPVISTFSCREEGFWNIDIGCRVSWQIILPSSLSTIIRLITQQQREKYLALRKISSLTGWLEIARTVSWRCRWAFDAVRSSEPTSWLANVAMEEWWTIPFAVTEERCSISYL